jgi:hypothetical protein
MNLTQKRTISVEELPSPSLEVSVVDRFPSCKILCIVQRTEGAVKTSEWAPTTKVHSWEGPLPGPRVSPRLTIGHVLAEAKVRYEMDHPCLRWVES